MSSVISFLVLCVFVYILGVYYLTKAMRRLKNEIGLIPEEINPDNLNPLLGQNFHDITPPVLLNDYKLIIFAMPSCRVCEPGIEKIIQLQKKHGLIPVEVLIFEGEKSITQYKEKYEDLIEIRVIPTNTKIFKFIEMYPTYAVINSNLEVINLFQDETVAYSALREYTRNNIQLGEAL